MSAPISPRNLTIDEKKAAEAAFNGRPFDLKWSPASRAVYDGIRGALGIPTPSTEQPTTDQTELNELPVSPQAAPQPMITPHEEAIQADLLIDVTAIAHSMGLPLPVRISKPLWDFVITASGKLPEEQHEARVRDVLMAFRLRLAIARVVSPLIEFPALLSFPPEPAPQLCSLHAIMHADPAAPFSLTLLLSNEISAAIRPPQN